LDGSWTVVALLTVRKSRWRLHGRTDNDGYDKGFKVNQRQVRIICDTPSKIIVVYPVGRSVENAST
jgi:hypothetical protein